MRDDDSHGVRPFQQEPSARCTFAEIDDHDVPSEWDDFVSAQAGDTIMQSTHWARLKAAHWGAVRVRVGECARPEGVAQILVRDLAPGAVGYVPGGPLIESAREPDAASLVQEMLRAARTQKIRALVVQPPTASSARLDRALRAEGFTESPVVTAPTATIEVDLTAHDDELFARMRASRRRNIRKAARSGIEVVRGRTAQDLSVFLDLYRSTANRQKFSALSPEYVRAQWETLHPGGFLELFLARIDGRAIAGATVTRWGERTVFKLAGWSREATDSSLRPNDLLHWEIIKWSKSEGCAIYDLGGFDRATTERLLVGEPLDQSIRTSPAQFKLGFGGRPVMLPVPLWRLGSRSVRSAQPLIHALMSRWRPLHGMAGRLRSE